MHRISVPLMSKIFCFRLNNNNGNRTVGHLFGLCLLMIALFGASQANAVMSYLENDTIKIGVDTSKGGTITYLIDKSDGRDIVNSYDLGRMIQQSYYSGPVPFDGGSWGGQDWPWNPVAAGDADGYTSTVLEHTNDGQTIYVKSIPKQWALQNVDSECTFEQWIELEANVAKVRCQLNNARSDLNQYPARHQELPAVYTNVSFCRLFTYTASAPFTNGALTQILNSGPPWEYFYATENWSALVDSNDWGLGVFHPKAQYTVGGMHWSGNPANSTGNISPLRTEHIDYNIVYKYECYMILGSLNDIRNYVYQHRPAPLPNYVFIKDRQGWCYHNTTDAGFPINGFLRVDVGIPDPIMLGPLHLWDSADVPKLYIRARSNASSTLAQLFWNEFGGSGYSEAKSVKFNLIPDSQFHTYKLNLADDPDYIGKIWHLRFDPVASGSAGEYVDIEYISAYPIPGDFDRDEDVDFTDFAVFVNHWLDDREAGFTGDLDDDRNVDFGDLAIFAQYWMESL